MRERLMKGTPPQKVNFQEHLNLAEEVDIDENAEVNGSCSEYIPDTSAESPYSENSSCSEYLPDTSEECPHSENSSCSEYIPDTSPESPHSERESDGISAIEREKVRVKKLVSMVT